MVVSIPGGVDPPALLVLLADGRLHSGEWLAVELGVTRAAVWKGVERLRGEGIEIRAVARRGYQLPRAVEWLAEAPIRACLDPQRAPRLHSLELLFDVDSTNSRLLAAGSVALGLADVVMAERQRAGRGRRGKTWLAPFGGSIALSLSWSFADSGRAAPSLSLAVGVAVSRALVRAGAVGIRLKWPNDLWYQDRKVGGVLLELRAETGGPAQVVIGVGLNVDLAAAARRQIEATGVQIAAVADACTAPPSRNFLAGAIIDELLSMLVEFEEHGFAPFYEAWMALDALGGRAAHVHGSGGTVSGTARGVDARGALLLERDGAIQYFMSGEVSLRLGEGGPVGTPVR